MFLAESEIDLAARQIGIVLSERVTPTAHGGKLKKQKKKPMSCLT